MIEENNYRKIATLGPLGYLPYPGTVGSLVAVPLVIVSNYLGISSFLFWLFLLGLSISSIIIITRACRSFVSPDPREIIIDEVVGCSIALYGLALQWQLWLASFLLFRFFDGTKLCGVGYIEKKIPGAYGILCDDIAAALLVQISIRFLTGYLI